MYAVNKVIVCISAEALWKGLYMDVHMLKFNDFPPVLKQRAHLLIGNCNAGLNTITTPSISYVVDMLWQDSDDVVTIFMSTCGTNCWLQYCVSVPPWFLPSDLCYCVPSWCPCSDNAVAY